MSAKTESLVKHLQDLKLHMAEVTASVDALLNELGAIAPIQLGASPVDQLKKDLGDNLQHLNLSVSGNEVRLSPKRFLGSQLFRPIADTVRRDGGRWDGRQRVFIVPLKVEGKS